MICSRVRRPIQPLIQTRPPRRNIHVDELIKQSTISLVSLGLTYAAVKRYKIHSRQPLGKEEKDQCVQIAKKMNVAANAIYLEGKKNEGSHTLGWIKPIIVVEKPFCPFIVSHELAHVKHKDYPIRLLTLITSFKVMAYILGGSWGILPAGIMWTLGNNYFAKWQEKKADLTAAHTVSDKELSYGIRFFAKEWEAQKNVIRQQKGFLIKVLFRLTLNEQGELRSYWTQHPPLEERISYLKHAYSQRFSNPIYLEVNNETIELDPDVINSLRKIIQDSNNEKHDHLFDLQKITFITDRPENNIRFMSINENILYKTIDPELIQRYLRLELKNLSASHCLEEIVEEACQK